MEFNQVCISLQQFFMSNKFCKILMPISMPLMFVSAGLKIFDRFITIGSFANSIVYFTFMLSLLMVLSNQLFQIASYGIGIWAIVYVISFIKALFGRYTHTVSWGNMTYAFIWGFLAFLLYKKSLAKS